MARMRCSRESESERDAVGEGESDAEDGTVGEGESVAEEGAAGEDESDAEEGAVALVGVTGPARAFPKMTAGPKTQPWINRQTKRVRRRGSRRDDKSMGEVMEVLGVW